MKFPPRKAELRRNCIVLITLIAFSLFSVSLCLAAKPAKPAAKANPSTPTATTPAKSPAPPAATAPPSSVDAPATPAEELSTEVAGYRIVNGIAIYPILPGNDEAVQALLNSLSNDPDFQGIKLTLYSPVGSKPKILLTGQSDDRLRYAVQKLKAIMKRIQQPHKLVVGAYLREISISNSSNEGLSWFSNGIAGGLTSPNTSTITTTEDTTSRGGATKTTTKTDTGYTLSLTTLPTVIGNLIKTSSKGKVIVGSEVTIVNGSTADLKNEDSIPVPLTDGSVTTFNTQTITSDVKITPTIIEYNDERPEESIVRLDVVIQLSVPTNTVKFSSGSSASEYTTQTLTATHYVRANNEKIIGGLFASDTWQKSHSGIPILMDLPLLKYLFSNQSINLEHIASILTLNVRILPVDKETGYDY